MRNILFFILYTLITLPLAAQINDGWFQNHPLIDTLKFEFKVSIVQDDLGLIKYYQDDLTHPFHTKIVDLGLDSAAIKFTAFPYHGEGGRSDLHILGITRSSENNIEPFANENIILQFSKNKKLGVDYSILDVTEDFLEFGEKYYIEMERHFYTDFNPDIPLQKMGLIWDVGPVVLATGGVLWGNSVKKQGQESYERYQELWRSGDKKNEGVDETTFLKDAKDKQENGNIILASSIASAAILESLVWYFRQKRNKRIALQKDIQEYQQESSPKIGWQLQPSYFNDFSNHAVGLALIGTF